MRPSKTPFVGGIWFVFLFILALTSLRAHTPAPVQHQGWWQAPRLTVPALTPRPAPIAHQHVAAQAADIAEGRALFERETFGGNGRTCLTCHGRDTGTVSP